MAGDWIKLQKDTPDKPEVLAIASRMGLDPDAVVGKLVRVWAWFDTHTTDGHASSVTFALLDRLAGVTGFAEQMELVGWLTQNGHDLSIPNFEYHTGESAKKRALAKNRQEKRRSNADSHASSVTKALPEKRREEKRNTTSNEVVTRTRIAKPSNVSQQVWSDWITLRKAKKAPVTETVVKKAGSEAAKAGMSLEQFLSVWCSRGSQGLEAAWLTNGEKPKAQSFAKQDELERRKRWEDMTGRKWPDSQAEAGTDVFEAEAIQLEGGNQ